MLFNAEQISQPYSGEYEEKIYDIESNWNSSDWIWIRFEEILPYGVENLGANILGWLFLTLKDY